MTPKRKIPKRKSRLWLPPYIIMGMLLPPDPIAFRSSSTRATRSIDKSDELYVRRRLKSATDLQSDHGGPQRGSSVSHPLTDSPQKLSAAPLILLRFALLPCLASGDMEDLSHGKSISPQDASAAYDQARHVRRQLTNPLGCRSLSSPSQNTTTTSPSSAVDKCIVERYRELANRLRNRSAAATSTAATLVSEYAGLVPCLSSSSEEEEEYRRRKTQAMYWRHLDADA